MIAAISANLAAPSRPASTTSTGWYFARVPDLNRETKQRITKASAWPTFMGICFALRQEGRKGRTAAIRQAAREKEQIGVGLRHLARDMGLNVSTVRRHVGHLVEIGVIVVHRPNVTFATDPTTGRIVTKAKGRCENTRVYLTIQPHHLRPAKASVMGADCAHQPPQAAPCKAQIAPTVRESLRNQREPDGLATGVGQPQAPQAGRLPAAEAGGHTAAQAGQEGKPIVPQDAGRDEPVLPAGRLLRASTPSTPTRRYSAGKQEPPPRSAAQASADFCKPDPRMDQMRAEYLAAKAAKREQAAPPKAKPVAPPAPPNDTFDTEAARQRVLATLAAAGIR